MINRRWPWVSYLHLALVVHHQMIQMSATKLQYLSNLFEQPNYAQFKLNFALFCSVITSNSQITISKEKIFIKFNHNKTTISDFWFDDCNLFQATMHSWQAYWMKIWLTLCRICSWVWKKFHFPRFPFQDFLSTLCTILLKGHLTFDPALPQKHSW